VFRHASWVAAMLLAAPVRVAAQSSRRSNVADAAVVSITGNIHGSIPPAACFERGKDGIAVEAFDETTGHSESGSHASSASFELEMGTGCVAPFFQALFAREHLSARVTFTGSALRAPYSMTLEDARLTHVDLGLVSTGGRSRIVVAIGLSTPHVVLGDTSGSIIQAASVERPRARAFRASAPRAAGMGNADAWMRRGVDAAMHLATNQPATDETSHIRHFRLSVESTVARNNTAAVRIRLDSVLQRDMAEARPDSEQLDRHALLNQATLLVNGQDGTTGITVWLKGAQITHPGSRGDGRRTTSLAISAASLTITDISSGRTASTP